jgi:hypothetical protein
MIIVYEVDLVFLWLKHVVQTTKDITKSNLNIHHVENNLTSKIC